MRSIGIPELLVLIGPLVLLGFAVFLFVSRMRWRQSHSVQRALIEKLPPNELATMLHTPQGEKLVQSLSGAGATPGRSIVTSVERGIFVLVMGAGLFWAGAVCRWPQVIAAMALVLIVAGIGQLAAATASYWLSKRWHLLQ